MRYSTLIVAGESRVGVALHIEWNPRQMTAHRTHNAAICRIRRTVYGTLHKVIQYLFTVSHKLSVGVLSGFSVGGGYLSIYDRSACRLVLCACCRGCVPCCLHGLHSPLQR